MNRLLLLPLLFLVPLVNGAACDNFPCPPGEECVQYRNGTVLCKPVDEVKYNCGDGSTAHKPFGDVASLFNVFVFEGFNCKYSDTEGRLAAGGDIDVVGYTVGCRAFNPQVNCIELGNITCSHLQATNQWMDTVVSGANVHWSQGEVKAGNLIYGTSSTLSQVTLVSDCETRQDTVIDFALQKSFLEGVSAAVKDAAVTGTVVDNYGSLIFQGTGAQVEVFSLNAATLGGAHGITFSNLQAGATVLINVAGTSVSAGNFGFFNANPHLILWNFWEATSLTFFNIQWEGSVLAVKADIKEPTGQINGQIFANSWQGDINGTCMQQNHAPFEGCVPDDEGGELPPPPPVDCFEECLEGLFGATYYNGFYKDNFVCENSDIEGRLAVGGNTDLTNMGIGSCILVDHSSSDNCVNYQSCIPLGANREGLVVEGNIAGNNIGVDAGDIIHGGSITGGANVNGVGCQAVQQSGYIDFDAEFVKFNDLCANLNTLPATGTATNQHGTVTLTGQGNLDREVFHVDASELAIGTMNGIRMNQIKAKATIVINVSGASLEAGNFGFLEDQDWKLVTRYTIWNFCDATSITLRNVGWRGTILAPKATIHDTTGQIDGQIIARSLGGNANTPCIEHHEHPFAGCIPECF